MDSPSKDGTKFSVVDELCRQASAKCYSLVAVDRFFTKIKAFPECINGELPTAQEIQEAADRMDRRWSSINPDNIAFIQQKICSRAKEWAAAKKCFKWLRRGLTWDNNTGMAKMGDRSISRGDLEEAEAACARKFMRVAKAKEEEP